MMSSYNIQNVNLVNEGKIQFTHVLIEQGRISKIGEFVAPSGSIMIDGKGQFLLPGIIDAQVHFREPGLTHKGDFASESRAAVAGGVTSVMDMPNTRPNVLSDKELEEKSGLARQKSLVNFGFFMGVNDQNLE